jgi:site-specific DNA-methyltransferase (adenine-specific)
MNSLENGTIAVGAPYSEMRNRAEIEDAFKGKERGKTINLILLSDAFAGVRALPDNSVDMVLIDPPYLTTSEDWDKQEAFSEALLQELRRVSAPHASLYVWCGIGEKSQSLIRWFPWVAKHFYFKDLITWKKQRGIGMRKGWLYTREEIIWAVKDNKAFIWNTNAQYSTVVRKNPKGFNGGPTKSEFKRFSNVWDDITEESFNTSRDEMASAKRQHFTPKPILALERIIRACTLPDHVVLDCFGASGSTGLAARNTGRDFILMDNDPISHTLMETRLKEEKNVGLFSEEVAL